MAVPRMVITTMATNRFRFPLIVRRMSLRNAACIVYHSMFSMGVGLGFWV